MKDSKILGTEFFSDDPELLRQLWKDHFADTYQSNWYNLRIATSSVFNTAAHSFGELLTSWQRGTSCNQPAAETSFVMELDYRAFVLGPLLATIIQSAFCLESLVRIVAQIILVTNIDNVIARLIAVDGFDRKCFDEKLKESLALAGCKPLSNELNAAVTELFQFRNSCAHDTPLYRNSSGKLLQVKRGKIKQLKDEQSHRIMYPALHTSQTPLTIIHARQAIETHDAVVSHMKDSGSEEFFETYQNLCPDSPFDGIMATMPLFDRADIINNQIEIWENDVLPWKDQIPNEELEQLYRQFVRNSKIKRVK